MFSGAVLLGEFRVVFFESTAEDFEMGFDGVGDVLEEGGSTSLSLVFDDDSHRRDGLDLHFGAGEAGEFARDVKFDSVGDVILK